MNPEQFWIAAKKVKALEFVDFVHFAHVRMSIFVCLQR
jgi:hypothetical protein